MKIVIFLSGKRKTKQWHQERDSIAASVEIPNHLVNEFLEALECRGSLGDDCPPYPEKVMPSDPLPYVSTGELDDLVSDMCDFEGCPDRQFYKDVHEVITMSENDCGYVHIVR